MFTATVLLGRRRAPETFSRHPCLPVVRRRTAFIHASYTEPAHLRGVSRTATPPGDHAALRRVLSEVLAESMCPLVDQLGDLSQVGVMV